MTFKKHFLKVRQESENQTQFRLQVEIEISSDSCFLLLSFLSVFLLCAAEIILFGIYDSFHLAYPPIILINGLHTNLSELKMPSYPHVNK